MRCNWTIRCLFALSTILLLCGARTGGADDAGLDLTGAVEAAKAARESFKPISNKKFEAARTAIESATADLTAWLNSGGRRKANGWKKYLKWDVLESQLAAGDEASLKELQVVIDRLSNADVTGLEKEQFLQTRDALQDFFNALYTKTTPEIAELHTKQMDLLVAALEAYSAEPTTQRAAVVGAGLDYFERTGQVPGLIKGVRSKFAQPNLFVQASQDFVAAGLDREVDQTGPIQEVIMGTSLYGSGRTIGRVSGNLIENDKVAEIEVHMTGVNYSNNVGYNGPVTVYTTGTTYVDARKRLLLDADGLVALAAYATANTNSSINRIAAKCCIVRAAARRRASQQEGQAEAIASHRAAGRVAGRFDTEVEAALTEPREKYEQQFRGPLVRKGEFPQRFHLSSTEQTLMLAAMQANGAQLAANTAPPKIGDGADLSVQVHESMTGNFSEAVLGGMRLTDEELAEMLEKQTGEVPEELQISEDKEPWSITFANRQPMSAVFGDNTVWIAVQGRAFSRGDTVLREPIRISATYTLERTPTGSKLTRQGDVDVNFLRSGGRLNIRQVTFKTFMRRKFGAMFKEEFVGEGLKLPGRMENIGTLQLTQMDSGNGWIALGWKLPAQEQGAE